MEVWHVTIESMDDGRVSHVIGPFPSATEATAWRNAFLARYEYDEAFIEVHEARARVWNPEDADDIADLDEWYEGYAREGEIPRND